MLDGAVLILSAKEGIQAQTKLLFSTLQKLQIPVSYTHLPQIRSPADSIVANHVIIGRPGLYAKEETRSKGLKICLLYTSQDGRNSINFATCSE